MSGTIQQSQTNLFSINKRNIDLRIEKKQLDIHNEDFTCVIDEVEFVKIIDTTTQTPLPVVEATQANTTLLPRKSVSKFFSRLWNRLTFLSLTMPLCLVMMLGLFVGKGWGQTATRFNDGYLSVFRVTSSSALASTGTQIVIDEYLTGTSSQSSPNYSSTLTTGSSGVVVSGSASSAGAISLSENGRYLVIPGYAAAIGAANTTFTSIGTARLLNGSGSLLSGMGTGSIYTTANDLRGATSDDGSNYWFSGGSLGIRYSNNGASVTTVSSTSTNTRVINIFNGQLFYSTGSGTNGIYKVGNGKPTSSSTTSTITAGSTAPYGFSLSPDGLTIYAMGSANTVVRFTYSGSYNSSTYSYSGGTWSAASTGFTLTGVTGIAVDWANYSFTTGTNGAIIYACNSTTLVKGSDNGTGAITTTTLRTISGNNAFRGLAFSPIKQTVSLGTNSPAVGNISQGSTNLPLFQFNLSADEGNSTIKKLILSQTGSATIGSGNSISNFRLYSDPNGDGSIADGSLLSTANVSGTNITFSSIIQTYINQGSSNNYIVIGDVSASGSGTFIPTITANKTLNSINYTANLINAGSSWVNIGSTAPTGNTLTIVSYTVTFNGNGNTGGSMSTQTSGTATNLTSNTFTRTGYTFAGWNTIANGTGTSYANGASYPFTSSTTLYAQWTANSLTFTYDSQGGSAISSGSTTTGGSISVSPGTPTRAGYTFNGWFAAASGGTAITFPYTHGQTTNFTLYAQWSANTLTISFDSQGGSSISNGSTTTGGTVVNPGNPNQVGYTFNGWFIASTGGTAISFPYTHNQTANFTLYAQWTITSSPTISGAATATAFTTTYGTVSTPQSFSITGSTLTNDITATAPTGFEVSNDNSTFGSTATFIQSGGSASGTLYIRLAATAAVSSSYNSQNISLTSTGASTVNIATAASGNTVTAKGLTITGISISNKTYDGNTTATISGTAAYSGLVNGESFSVTDTPSATFIDKNVGNGKSVSVAGYTAPSANYSITQPTALTANITVKELTITSAAVTPKTYDGTNTATITGSLSGVVLGDAVTLNGTGTFASVNVGTGISVTSTSSLSGGDAGNYTLTQPTGLSGDITGASQTITFASLTPATLSTADYSPGATASSGLTVSYSSSNSCVATIVGGNIHIVGAGTTTITASQSGGGNYSAASSVNQTLTVMNPTSTLAAGDIVIIAYNTNATPDNFAILFTTDVAAGTVFYVNDNELSTSSSTNFSDLNEVEASFTVKAGQTIAAGTVIVLPWGSTAVSGAQYDWSSTSGAGLGNNNEELYIYTASSITATAPTTFISYTKIGTSTSAIPSSLALGTTAIEPSGAALRYATTGATYSGTKQTLLSAIGNTATNWNTTGATTFASSDWTFSVSPSPTLNSSGTLSAVNTTYGTASATPTSFSLTANNLSTDLSVTAPIGFEISSGSGYNTTLTISPDGCGKISSTTIYVRLAATTSVGTYSGNIVLSSTGATSVNVATVSSTVSAKSLTITGLSAADKTYDGLTTVSVSGTPSYSGLVNGESFSVTGTVTWAFPNATVENIKTLTRTGNFNAPSGNYTVTQPTLTASITSRSLTITANNVNKPFGATLTGGSGSTAFTSSGLQNGETIGSITIAYGNGAGSIDAVGTYSVQVTPSAATGGTFTASNYSISYVAGDIIVSDVPTLDAVILTSALNSTYGTASTGVSFTASGSSLSATITATAQSGYEVSSDNSIFSSSVSISSGSTVYVRFSANLAAGSYNIATSVVLTSSGASSANVTTSSSGNTVSVKGLTIAGISISNKIYDGNITASITGTAAYSGLVNGESFSVSGTPSATFSDKNVGNNKTITVVGYTSPSSNYSLTQPSGLLANITTATLTLTSAAVSSKVYDGTTLATITGTLSGVISPDVVTMVGTGTFASANVGTGINVTSTSTLNGIDAGNYSLTQPAGLTGEITKANQTITFGALANKTTSDVPFNLSATASSGLAVTYSSSNTSVATVNGNTLTIVGAGTTTITASQSGDANFNSAIDVAQSQTITIADIEEIVFPQYIQGLNGTNSNRIPSAYYLKINNLNPNTTYRFYCGFVTSSDLSTSSGAGNNIYVNYSGGSFTRSSSPSLSTANNYGTLTTNSNGSFTGWFVMEPTGNATRFVPGTNLFLRVTLNDGNNGTTATNYRTTINSTKVINLVSSAGANNGTGLYGTSSAGAKNFVVLYDNVNGTGRPISTSFVEDDGTANTTANSYSNFYNTNVNGVSGAYGVIIPNNNSTGIKRIEFKKTTDNSLIYSVTDNDGNWSGSANTINPTGGTTAISIPNTTFDDATFNEITGVSLLQNTKINGTLTLSQGTLTVGPNELTLNSNIVRTTGLIDASNSSATIVFGGSTAQSIPASTFTGNINNLTLSNSASLSISQDLSVVGALTLSSGKLTLGTNHLTLGETATISGTFSSNNMIIATGLGELRKRFAQGSGDLASFTFPVGNGGAVAEYTPIVLDFASGNYGASAYVSVRVQDSKQGTLNSSVTNYLNRNWIVEPNDITGFSYKIQLYYVDADFITDGSMAEGDLKPIKISSGQWYQPTDGTFTNAVSQGSAGVFASANYLEWNGLTTFSEFGGASGSNLPLPVELLSFTAECAKETIVLKWQTASEFNSAYFEIQKSLDGITWNTIGNQTAAGNSNELLSYSFEDASKTANTTYYRLNQVDNDGLQKYYGPISPMCETINHLNGKTIPNPSNDEFWLQISSNEQQKFTYVLQDVNGSKIMENSADLLPGTNLFPIRETIPSGMYFIVVQTENGQQQVIKHIRN